MNYVLVELEVLYQNQDFLSLSLQTCNGAVFTTHTEMLEFAKTDLHTDPRKNFAIPLLLCAANATIV